MCCSGTVTDDDPVVKQLLNKIKLLEQQVEVQNVLIAELQRCHSAIAKRFGFEYIKTLPKRNTIICHYTSLLTIELFEWLCETFSKVGLLPKSMANLHIYYRILLVLMKLKLATTDQDLAVRFEISVQRVSSIMF